jgi:uncharacterized protein (TIGR00297 family)|tara:strand:- start:563 stop:2008 length:1446 start_codon:yes stop_codon:yes gene_type:complete
MSEWSLFSLILIGIFAVLLAANWLQFKFKLKPESIRIFVHILIGLVVLFCIYIFKSKIQLILLSIIFVGFNLFSIRTGKFQSLNNTSRKSFGTVYFPLSILILLIFFWEKPISLILSILVMTLADPIATIIGNNGKITFTPWRDKKSQRGSIAMFGSTLLIIMIGTDLLARIYNASFFIPFTVLLGCSLFTALSATLAESISFKGSDNISVPITTFISYEIFLINYTHGTLTSLVLWTFLSLIIFYYSWYRRSLSSSGAISGYLIGIIIFGAGGWTWIIPLVFFFISSSILSHLNHKKFPERNILQILANGSLGAFFALIYFFYQFPPAIILYLGAIGAATADTWATEIGFYSKNKPKLIFSKIIVNHGASGGITMLGLSASILGAFIIGILGEKILGMNDVLFPIAIGGLAGSVTDSILGRFIQAQFKCTSCNSNTENRYHCDKRTKLIFGSKFIGNDMVNFVNTLVGAIVTYYLWMFYG